MSATTTVSEPAAVSEIPPGHASTRHKLGNPWAYFVKCLKLYADGRGRAGMAEYWSFVLITYALFIPLFVLVLADPALNSDGVGNPGVLSIIGLLGFVVVGLGLFIPSITVAIRRLHDIGLSGWFALLAFVPFGSLVLLGFTLAPSSQRENKHGPSPKADPSAAFA